MLLYRVFRYLRGARVGENGHPLFLHRPQGRGRWDNPAEYDAWYLSRTPEGAVAETFGGQRVFRETMFDAPLPPGARFALATFQLDDATPVLDLDNANALAARGLRPSRVVSRNRSETAEVALRAFRERRNGDRKWAGLGWWSVYWYDWSLVCLWVAPGEALPLATSQVDDLHLGHPAVIEAARVLNRECVR